MVVVGRIIIQQLRQEQQQNNNNIFKVKKLVKELTTRCLSLCSMNNVETTTNK